MQRTFLSNLSLLLLLNLLIKPAYLLLVETEVQNRVGADTYGAYAALLSLSFLLNIFLDLGINTFTSRAVARKAELSTSYFSTVALLRGALVLLYFGLLFLVAFLLGYEKDALVMLGWLGFNQLLAASILYLRSNLSGLMLFKRDAIVSVLDRGVLLVGLGLVLWFTAKDEIFDIYWLIYAQTAAYALGLLAAIALLFKKTGKVKLKWRPVFNRVILRQSLPYALLVLLMMVYYKTDSVMLERMLPDGDYHAGVYAMSYRLFEATNMVGYLFATLLLPLFSKAIKAGEDVSPVAGNAFRLILVGGGIVAMTCALWPTELLSVVYDNDIEASAPAFVVLMISFFFFMMSYLWGTLLTANGDMRLMNRIAAIAVLFNIGLNYLLIPTYTAFGSAVASLATQALVAVLQLIIAYRKTGARLERSVVIRSVAFVVIVSIFAFGTTIITAHWLLLLAVFVAFSALAAFAIRLLRPVHLSILKKTTD
jgi:O-antigen/teichoic acid export membrane protein